jgi:O-antigen/teichoic acid export membrane protein
VQDTFDLKSRALGGDQIVRRFALQGSTAVLVKVASAGLAYMMMVLIARVTTTEQFGVFAVAFSIAISSSFISNLGQSGAILRFWPQWIGQGRPQKARLALKFSMAIAAIGLAAAGALILLAGTASFFVGLPWSFGIAGATALLAFAMGWAEVASAGLRAREFVFLALLPRDVIWRLVVCALAGTLFIFQVELEAQTIVLILAGVLSFLVIPQVYVLCRSFRGIGAARLASEDRELQLRTSVNLWLANAFNILQNHAGILIVSAVLSVDAAGAYFAAERTAGLLSLFFLAVGLVSTPRMSQYFHSGRTEFVRVIITLSGLGAGSAAAVAFCFLALLGGDVLALFEASYAASLPVLLTLSLGHLFQTTAGSMGLLLSMSGHERVLLALQVCIGVPAIGLQIVGGVFYGPLGVAIAAAGGMICLNVAAALFVWRRLGIAPAGLSLVWKHFGKG